MVEGKNTPANITFKIVNYTILFLFFLICTYPFYYVFIYSVSNPYKVSAGLGITIFPISPTFSNYVEIFKTKGMGQATFISLARTVSGTFLTVACCSFFGYLVTKPLYFRKFIYRFVVATMYFSSGLIPYYLTIRAYGLFNNFLIYIIPGAVSAYYVILFKTFIEQIPPSMEEAAAIEGAGHVSIFLKIIIPLSVPIVATIAVFCSVGQWNAWFDNYIYVSSKDLATLQLKLYELLQAAETIASQSNTTVTTDVITRTQTITPMAVRMTLTMVVTLPIILVYPYMQRFFVRGLMLGAVKG